MKAKRAFTILWVVICILGFLGFVEQLFANGDNKIASFTEDLIIIIYFPLFHLLDIIGDEKVPGAILVFFLLVLPFFNGYIFVFILTKIYNWVYRSLHWKIEKI